MFRPDWNALKAACGRKGYAFFEKGRLNLNLIGVRHSDYASNGFDDVLCCAYMDPAGVRHVEHWPATTDPGTHWLQKEFMNPKGCAVLVPEQVNVWFTTSGSCSSAAASVTILNTEPGVYRPCRQRFRYAVSSAFSIS